NVYGSPTDDRGRAAARTCRARLDGRAVADDAVFWEGRFIDPAVDQHIAPDPHAIRDIGSLADHGDPRGEPVGQLLVGDGLIARADDRARADHDLLIDHHLVEQRARPYPCIVHHHAVFDHRAGADIDARAERAVDHHAPDHAAV